MELFSSKKSLLLGLLGACACAVPLFYCYGISLSAFEYISLLLILLVLSFYDLKQSIVPHAFLILACGVRLFYLLLAHLIDGVDLWKQLSEGFFSAIFVFVSLCTLVIVTDFILKHSSLGGGDIKLFALLAFYFNWWYVLVIMMIACVLALIFILLSRDKKEYFAFVPAISAACFIVMLCRDFILLPV